MVKQLLSNIKSKLTAVIAVVLAICFGLMAVGCDSETDFDYAVRIAREEFGCKKILWITPVVYRNELTKMYYYDTDGTYRCGDLAFSDEGGYLIVGVGEYGREMIIAAPGKDEAEDDPMRRNPRLIQWPFAYSFTEIANFAAEYGYEYADGIDKYKNDEYWLKLEPLDTEQEVKDAVENLGTYINDDGIYDRLDVKFMFRFSHCDDDGIQSVCFIAQESGELKLYQLKGTTPENTAATLNVITYVRDKSSEKAQ